MHVWILDIAEKRTSGMHSYNDSAPGCHCHAMHQVSKKWFIYSVTRRADSRTYLPEEVCDNYVIFKHWPIQTYSCSVGMRECEKQEDADDVRHHHHHHLYVTLVLE